MVVGKMEKGYFAPISWLQNTYMKSGLQIQAQQSRVEGKQTKNNDKELDAG